MEAARYRAPAAPGGRPHLVKRLVVLVGGEHHPQVRYLRTVPEPVRVGEALGRDRCRRLDRQRAGGPTACQHPGLELLDPPSDPIGVRPVHLHRRQEAESLPHRWSPALFFSFSRSMGKMGTSTVSQVLAVLPFRTPPASSTSSPFRRQQSPRRNRLPALGRRTVGPRVRIPWVG